MDRIVKSHDGRGSLDLTKNLSAHSSDQTIDVIAVVQRMISRDKARARLSDSGQ
jgi:hypothetical protein